MDWKNVSLDRLESLKTYAEREDAEAQFLLGMFYLYGIVFEKNLGEAVKWLQRAVGHGYIEAMQILGFEIITNEEICEIESEEAQLDNEGAYNYLQEGADRGDAYSQFYLALLCWNWKRDENLGMEYFYKAADNGVPHAQCKLGMFYENGIHVKRDKAQAVKWYRKAAEQGDAEGQCFLSQMYAHSRGVKKNLKKALDLLQKSAEQEYEYAQFLLGHMYATGEGVEKNEVIALAWYRKAAEQGDEGMLQYLADLYREGECGLEKDEEIAFELELKAGKWVLDAESGTYRAKRVWCFEYAPSYFFDKYVKWHHKRILERVKQLWAQRFGLVEGSSVEGAINAK